MKRIVLTGGGTAGHVTPNMALVPSLKEAGYDAAVDLAEQGCNIIIANSFGHESYILQAAADYPDVLPHVRLVYHPF